MKDINKTETRNPDPEFVAEEFAYNNMLALPVDLKRYLTDKNMDWRFLNANQFRQAGNYHRSHWKPFNAGPEVVGMINGITAEGLVKRGDLILGVRPKYISVKHRESLKQRADAMSGMPKLAAQQLRQTIREKGLGEHVSVKEGYGKDDDSGDDE